VRSHGGGHHLVDFVIVLIEAETEVLAVHYCRRITGWQAGPIRAERGDTRVNYRGCQEYMYTPAQVDVTEVVP
jgi:hypothetical protein